MSPSLTLKQTALLDHEEDGPQNNNIRLDDKKKVDIDNILMPPPPSLHLSTNKLEQTNSSITGKRSRSNAIDLTYEIPNACGFTMDAFDFIEEDKENQQKSHDSKYTSNCISRNKEKRIKAYEQQVERTEPRKKKYVHIDSDPSTNKKSKHVSFLTDCNDCLINEIFYIDYDHSKSQEIFHSDRNRNEIESLHIVKGTNDVYRNELDGDSDDETLKEEEEKTLESNDRHMIAKDKNQNQKDSKSNKQNESISPNYISEHNLFSKKMTASKKVIEDPKDRCDNFCDSRHKPMIEELDNELDKEEEGEKSTSEGHLHQNKQQTQIQIHAQAQQDQEKIEFCNIEDESNEGTDIIGQSELIYDKPSIETRFADIIGHGHAKLRLDEMLLPLALPPSLAQSVLTGRRFDIKLYF